MQMEASEPMRAVNESKYGNGMIWQVWNKWDSDERA